MARFDKPPWAATVLLLPKKLAATAKIDPGAPASTLLSLPPKLNAMPINPWATAITLLPTAVANVNASRVVAEAPLPMAKDAPNNPSAWADAPSPIAKATLNSVLVHSALLPKPKNDAQ